LSLRITSPGSAGLFFYRLRTVCIRQHKEPIIPARARLIRSELQMSASATRLTEVFGRFGFASTVDLRSGRNTPGDVQTMAEGKGDAPAGRTKD
jgi:hypothetical protein